MQKQLVQCFTILLLVQTSKNLKNVYKYINREYAFPKCCEQGYYLTFNNATYSCKQGQTLNLQIGSKFNKSSDNCIDLSLNNATFNLIVDRGEQVYKVIRLFKKYPKCCPLGSAYDNYQHRCIFNNQTMLDQVEGLVVAIGMSKCRSSNLVVIDYSYTDKNITIHRNSSVQINNKIFAYGSYCFDTNINNGNNIIRVCENSKVICKVEIGDSGIPCFKKCCPDGEIYYNMKCVPTFNAGVSLDDTERIKWNDNKATFGIIQAEDHFRYRALPQHRFYIDEIGNMRIREEGSWKTYNSQNAIYCIETVKSETNLTQQFFLTELNTDYRRSIEDVISYLRACFMCASSIFVIITLIVYMILPDLQKFYGKPLVMYFITLIIGSFCCGFLGIYRYIAPPYCVTTGFLLILIFLSYFTWLNIICLDMWLVFGTNCVIDKKTESERFFWYNIYGWGFPIVWTILILIIYKTKCLPDSLVPHINNRFDCFFERRPDTYDFFIYYIGPITISLLCNCIFFIKTISHCFEIKNEIRRMNDHKNIRRTRLFHDDKEKLKIFLKLFILMGLSWLFEMLSTVIYFRDDPILRYIEYIWLCFNGLTGVFVFCIFVLKKNILRSLAYEIGRKIKK